MKNLISLDDNNKIKINNFIKVMNGKDISVQNLRIDGNVIGKLNINNESHFNERIHYFYNSDKSDKIRIYTIYGLPVIYR